MKRLLCILMCLGLVSVASAALSVTNGDFELNAGANIDDVTGWYDLNTGSFWESAWQSNAAGQTPNGTNAVVLTAYGSDPAGDLLAGSSYLYQSIGTLAGEASVAIGFDWGHPDDTDVGRFDGVTVSVFASDGTFVAADGTDIYGAAGVTLLDSASYTHTAAGTDGEIWGVVANLDLSGASAGDELFLRFNSSSEWPSLDNVSIVPEPATMLMLGLGSLVALKRRKA